jgi:hypothetical protein
MLSDDEFKNLLAYHQGPSLQTAFNRILTVLAPGGYLVMGSHEKLPASSFALVRDEKCPWVYQLKTSHGCRSGVSPRNSSQIVLNITARRRSHKDL